MVTLRRVFYRLLDLFSRYMHCTALLSLLTVAVVGFLHYQLVLYGNDLIYWVTQFLTLFGDLEGMAMLIIISALVFKFLTFIAVGLGNMRTFSNMSQVEVKKRYAEYLVVRLFTQIDNLEQKYLNHVRLYDCEAMEEIVQGHQALVEAIDNFRKDARKLVTPSESEVMMPIEEVFGLLEEEEQMLRQSRFTRLHGIVNEELIKSLLYP